MFGGKNIYHHFDRSFSEGRGRQILWLLSVLGIIIGVLILVNKLLLGESAISDIRIVELLLDPGNFVGKAEGDGSLVFQFIITVLGAIFFTAMLISVVGNIVDSRVEAYRKGLTRYNFKEHILILGSSSLLIGKLTELLNSENQHDDIVVLTSADVEDLRNKVYSLYGKQCCSNICILYGKRDDKSTLESVRVAFAKSIYIFGEDNELEHDSVNIECWNILNNIKIEPDKIINCWLVLERISSSHIFQYITNSRSNDNLHLFVVNTLESLAQKVFVSRDYVGDAKYPALDGGAGIDCNSKKKVHLIVVGMTQIAYAMATTAAHICHFPNFITKGIRTTISFVQPDIKQEMEFFKGHYNHLFKLSRASYITFEENGDVANRADSEPDEKYGDFLDIDWEFVDGGIESKGVRSKIEHILQDNETLLSIAICNSNAESNVAASLYLPDIVYKKNIPIYVYQPLSGVVLSSSRETRRYSNIYPFGMKSDYYDKSAQKRLIMAKGINYLYEQGLNFVSMPQDIKDLEINWFKLSYAKQLSNIYSANSIMTKMRSIKIDSSNELKDEDVAILSEVEHNRWNIEKLLLGFAPMTIAERNFINEKIAKGDILARKESRRLKDEEYIHKDIAPYSELESEAKQYDYAISKNIINILDLKL